MNEKIKAWECQISLRKHMVRKHGGRVPADALVLMRVSSESKNSRSVLYVSFKSKITELTGWAIGDKLDMKIENGSAIVFRHKDGYTLCGDSLKAKKTHNRVYVRFPFLKGELEGFPVGVCREIEAKPGVVAFLLPIQE